eukprot:15485264-Alexandrium_andersonii.AAC.1
MSTHPCARGQQPEEQQCAPFQPHRNITPTTCRIGHAMCRHTRARSPCSKLCTAAYGTDALDALLPSPSSAMACPHSPGQPPVHRLPRLLANS